MYAFAWFAFVMVVLLLCGHFLLLCGELSGQINRLRDEMQAPRRAARS